MQSFNNLGFSIQIGLGNEHSPQLAHRPHGDTLIGQPHIKPEI